MASSLPKAPMFDLQDALMMHQTLVKRHADGKAELASLVDDYVDVCTQYADGTTARDTHGDFVVQMEAMRGLLSAQRLSKGAASSSEQQRVYIVRSEWGKEFFTRTMEARNQVALDLVATVTELCALWACNIPDSSRFGAPVQYNDRTLVFTDPGLVIQKYPSFKIAKNYVNALHAVANAPLSRLHTPFACAVEVLGVTFVGMSICPIKSSTSNLTPLQDHYINAIAATLRFVKTSKTASTAPELAPPEVRLACGTDGRLYAVDATQLPWRGDILGAKQFVTYPRRELLFGVQGVATSPSSPVDFTLKYKMRPVFEHLLGLTGNTSGGHTAVTESFTRSAMHNNNVSISTYIGHIYGMLLEQERNFQATHDVAKHQQSTIMKQQYQARKKKFELCRSVLITEVVARLAKRFVREAWRKLAADPSVSRILAEMILDTHPDPRSAETSLNQLFIQAANRVIQKCFPGKTIVAQPGAAATTGTGAASHQDTGVWLEKDHEMFKELLFIANDVFIKRQLQRDNLAFTGTLAEIDFQRASFCLSEQLGLPVTFDGRVVAIESTANVLDHFFVLDGPTGGPLRSEAVHTGVELPICFKAGSKAKLVDFASLQQRIGTKVAQDPKATSEQLMMARFIHLLASDVTVAHRGFCLSIDYDEVLASSADPAVMEATSFFEVDVNFRRALLMGATEPVIAAKALGRFADKSRGIVSSPEDNVLVLASRIVCLCRLCEHSNSTVLVSMLQGAIDELNGYSGYVAPSQRRKVAVDPTKTTLRIGQCAHLYLPPLTILVRCVLQPDPSRPHNERIASAINLSCLRRDVIVAIYGETSFEAGVAADNIGSICSNNKYDLEKAEEEFEKAVAILNEVQPEGPSVFVTQNNLAFLYLRKAEMMKKNLRGINTTDGIAARQRVKELLDAAETLLSKVIAAEASVAPLDFATACNNMANIMLFRNRHKEASDFFEKTLAATERYANPQDEPHCRLHAQKNLRILARRRYMNAVLRIQMYVRRFVKNLRNRKSVIWTKAAMELQRIGRAATIRRECAMRYRFSAFHYWIRQPTRYFAKLPAVMQQLPPSKKVLLWQETVRDATYRLSKVLLGHRIRHNIGVLYRFQQTYFSHRRVGFEDEANTLRAREFSRGYISVKTASIAEQLYELTDLHQRAVKMEAVISLTDVRRMEAVQILHVIQEVEYSERIAVDREWYRVALHAQHLKEQQVAITAESEARMGMCCDYFLQFHEIMHRHLIQEEEDDFERNVNAAQSVDLVHLLEHRMRHQLFKQYETTVRGVYVAFIMPRVGRGYLLRRGLAAMRKLTSEETFQRELLTSEEQVVLSRPQLQKSWDYVFHAWNESKAREAILNALEQFWNMEAPLAVTAVAGEIKGRLALLKNEHTQYREWQWAERRHVTQAAERTQRRELIVDSMLRHREVLLHFEDQLFDAITAQATAEFRLALLKSIDFVIAYIASQEERKRHEILVEEDLDGVHIREDVSRGITQVFEESERQTLCDTETQERTSIGKRELLIKTEAAARATIAAFEMRFIHTIASELRKGARALIEREATVASVKLQLIETDRRERMHRDTLEDISLFHLAATCIAGKEAVHRHDILAQREREVLTRLAEPMQDSLRDIAQRFVKDKSMWRERWRLEQSETQEQMGLLHYRRALVIISAHDTWLRHTWHHMQSHRIESIEAEQRRVLVQTHEIEVRQLYSKLLEDLAITHAVSHLKELATLVLPILQERATHHISIMMRDHQHWTEALGVEIESVRVRERIMAQHDIETMSLYLMKLHHAWSTRLWIAQDRTVHMSVLSQSFEAITRLRNKAALDLLQRGGRALMARRKACAQRIAQIRAMRLLKRVGRAYLTRRALTFLAAEEVEHCMVYASEAMARNFIETEEEGAFNRLTLHASYNASRFSRGRHGGFAPPPTRPPQGVVKGLNPRIYSVPSWTVNGAMFRQKNAARGPIVTLMAAPVPPPTPQQSPATPAVGSRGASLRGGSLSSRGSSMEASRRSNSPTQ